MARSAGTAGAVRGRLREQTFNNNIYNLTKLFSCSHRLLLIVIAAGIFLPCFVFRRTCSSFPTWVLSELREQTSQNGGKSLWWNRLACSRICPRRTRTPVDSMTWGENTFPQVRTCVRRVPTGMRLSPARRPGLTAGVQRHITGGLR